MLTAFQEQVAAGKAIRSEQAAAASRFLDAFFKFLHHHHQNEDGECEVEAAPPTEVGQAAWGTANKRSVTAGGGR